MSTEASRVDRWLLRVMRPGVDEALHEGVVGRDLLEFAATEAVDAGVANVRDRDLGDRPGGNR